MSKKSTGKAAKRFWTMSKERSGCIGGGVIDESPARTDELVGLS
ncbi:hypothetical protein [Caldicellulosiruptor sp. DIB 104C]|nr:hypothetical protein [Caldicellulosiruptor sp. DIB 104C]